MYFLLHLWRSRCVTQLCFFPESICLGEHKQDLFPRRNMTAFLSWLMAFSFRSEKWLCIWSTQLMCSTRLSLPGLAIASKSSTLILPTIYCEKKLRLSSSAFFIIWCHGSDFPESSLYKWGLEWLVSSCCCLLKAWSGLCWWQWWAAPGSATPACLSACAAPCSEALGWSLGCRMHWKAGKSPCFV